jgi:hypothetical protein
MIVIGRPINGISLNGLEWLLDDNGDLIRFSDIGSACSFLLENGIIKDELDSFWFEDEETQIRLAV